MDCSVCQQPYRTPLFRVDFCGIVAAAAGCRDNNDGSAKLFCCVDYSIDSSIRDTMKLSDGGTRASPFRPLESSTQPDVKTFPSTMHFIRKIIHSKTFTKVETANKQGTLVVCCSINWYSEDSFVISSSQKIKK